MSKKDPVEQPPTVVLKVEYENGFPKEYSIDKVSVIGIVNCKLQLHLDRIDGTDKHLLICSEEMMPSNDRIKRITVLRDGKRLPDEDDKLRAQYANTEDGHPSYPIGDWRHEVNDGSTVRGYWEWVASRIEEEEHERQHTG